MPTTDALIIGAGPAGLLAADHLSARGRRVLLVERRPKAGWKLLVAGASGLNVSFAGPEDGLAYRHRQAEVAACLARYPRAAWIAQLESLGEEVFLGTSPRYFIRSPKAAGLLERWLERLAKQGVEMQTGHELVDFSPTATGVSITVASGKKLEARRALFAMGGPSWESAPPAWPTLFEQKGLQMLPFCSANAGFALDAPAGFFAKAEGLAIKGFVLRTKIGEREGEAMITRYGLEGTPLYAVGCEGPAELDLKPGLAQERLAERLQSARGPLAERLAAVKLSPGAQALVRAFAPAHSWESAAALASILKRFPLALGQARPLSESISASGGLAWPELDPSLQLKKFPGFYCAGEMVDWDAPTGGYLLQACVSMAAVAAHAIDQTL